MNGTKKFAMQELGILAQKSSDAIILPFRNEIIALCDAFDNSGQSGGSAPYVASLIAETIKKLLLYQPISGVTGDEHEWVDIAAMKYGKENIYQNSRCSGLFKDGINGKAYYIDAIAWKYVDNSSAFTGTVYVNNKNFKTISSVQFVKFPFIPKTFYIDVIDIPIMKEDAERRKIHYHENVDGTCYYTVVKNPAQLDEVFAYYDKIDELIN